MATTSTTTTTTTMATAFLLLVLFHLSTTASAIGVNYGTLGDNLPPPSEVAKFLQTQTTIDSVKIFDTNPDILRAFAGTNITVTVTVGNGDIPELVDAGAAASWVENNIKPYYPKTRINRVVVGNEILFSGNKNWIARLVPCMKSIHDALVKAGINDVQVTTPNTLGILENSQMPSLARIRPAYAKVVFESMLAFLQETKSPIMVNPYPYFSYAPSVADYILFKPNPGVHDDGTNITYTNMFVAMMDAVYSAIKAMGYGDVEIVVAETGWPSLGDPDQPACSVENAEAYNGHLIDIVSSGKGTPLQPNKRFETFIFALFNENLKPGTTAERNWGLFRPDFTPVYDVGILRNKQESGTVGPVLAPQVEPSPPQTGPFKAPVPSPGPVKAPSKPSPPQIGPGSSPTANTTTTPDASSPPPSSSSKTKQQQSTSAGVRLSFQTASLSFFFLSSLLCLSL